ncbi:UPF0481 protein At3g47200 [Morus notabilis]|uniref:UPF0481 protein At3g47200 n=1 Tax=Morus notabilis TaxID=981085 RepID=UPI000CECFC79|nr:UPF0481 protein At3g47200 [Morus notabilis]
MERNKDFSHLHQEQDQQPSDGLEICLRTKLQNSSPLPSECCIYTVPGRLRLANATTYTPRVVSIGPLHHGEESLRAMEKYKMLYLKSFLERTKMSLKDYIELVRKREQKVRNQYAENFESTSSNKFVEMILVDTAFVIEVLCKNHSKELVEENDLIFNRPWKVKEVREDMMLLENQLPFFMLEDVLSLAKIRVSLGNNNEKLVSLSSEQISLIKLTVGICFPNYLHKARVKCEVGSSRNLFDIQFRNRVLVIPQLQIRSSTQSFFLNLLAFEQCRLRNCYISNYFFILDRLIDTTSDGQLLGQSGVIESKLSDNQEVVASINHLALGSFWRRKRFHFNELCDGLNAHYANPWNNWITTIIHNHFSSPLTIFVVTTAAAPFTRSLIQTVCSCGVQFK